jgi:hypothetical protein
MRYAAGLIAHFCFLGLGAAAIVWAIVIGPTAWRYAALEGLAAQAVRGENISSDAIEKNIPAIDLLQRSETCWPKAMHNAAILRGRLVQVALENSDRRQFDASVAAADSLIRKSLSCAPSDSFLWFALFWVENLRFGLRDESLKYLEKSYQYGPYEGWIALKRNTFALALYRSLPEPVQKQAVLEFAAMVNSGFISDSTANLQGPGWPIRDVLLASLRDVKEKYRMQLAVRLRRLGSEAAIPGIDMPELRPWQVD